MSVDNLAQCRCGEAENLQDIRAANVPPSGAVPMMIASS